MSPLLPLALRFSDVDSDDAPVASFVTPFVALHQRLTSVYALAQRSKHIFASPLGPFYREARHAHVPRLVYFGPHTSDDSLRLAFYAGLDSADLRGTLALLDFVERLSLTPDLGQGLDLSFFPLADVTGLLRQQSQRLGERAWIGSAAAELDLLANDARGRAYHGFVRIESGSNHDDVITARLRGLSDSTQGIELIDSADFGPWQVQWEADAVSSSVSDGPLSLGDDLLLQPFELTLRLPATWSEELYRGAVATVLKNFILRHRAFHAYAQHL